MRSHQVDSGFTPGNFKLANRRMLFRWMIVLAFSIIACGIGLMFLLASWSRKMHPALSDSTTSRLRDCPTSPNCVCSQASRESQSVLPFDFDIDAGSSRARLLEMLNAMPRAKVVAQEETYLRAEFHTPFFGFVDDVEFFIDEDARTIHVRSASRIGYSDGGTNRRRVEQLRQAYAAKDFERLK